MSKSSVRAKVVRLGRKDLYEAIDILSRAFEHDPLMRFIFERSTSDFQSSLAELFRFSCEVRIELEWPLLGCNHDSRLVGVACVTVPEHRPWPKSLSKKYEKLVSAIGPEATDRLERYSALTDTHRPEAPHFYLAVFGVHPSFQGMGIGRLILNEVHTLSELHPTSIGVGLDTENEQNVTLYERFGYIVVVKTELNGMNLWSMFRYNQLGGTPS
jgi:ribosomal protein S18 acetylase RimI-like enzyme